MKALVLAGEAGTRFRPITHTSAKQSVPVANKPALFHGLEAIGAAGVAGVGIVVGDIVDEITEAVGDGSKFGLEITYITQHKPLGIAHAVRISHAYLGYDDFAMHLGDDFVVSGIAEPIRHFRAHRPDAHLLLTQVSDPRSFGVAELDGSGRVRRLEEKSARPKSDLPLVGVYLFSSAIHEAVQAIEPSWRGELEITHALQRPRRRAQRTHRTRPGRRGRRHPQLPRGRPRSDRHRHGRRRLLRRALHLHRRELPDGGQRGGVLHRAAQRLHLRGAADRGVPHRPARPGDPRATCAACPRLVLGDHNKAQISS